jgi:hypothetical protein
MEFGRNQPCDGRIPWTEEDKEWITVDGFQRLGAKLSDTTDIAK